MSPWGGSSAGRASRSQCEGREFDPPPLHHHSTPNLYRLGVFISASRMPRGVLARLGCADGAWRRGLKDRMASSPSRAVAACRDGRSLASGVRPCPQQHPGPATPSRLGTVCVDRRDDPHQALGRHEREVSGWKRGVVQGLRDYRIVKKQACWAVMHWRHARPR